MDDTARLELRVKAKAVEQFMELEASERERIFPLLNRGVQSSIEILELIAEKPLTFEEVADEMDMNPKSAKNLML